MTEPASPGQRPAETTPAKARAKRPGWVAWVLGAFLGLLGLAAAALIAIQQPSVATGLVNAGLGRVHVAGSVMRVDQVRLDWLAGFELRGLRVARGDTLLLAVDTLRARYRIASLLGGVADVRDLDLDGVLVTSALFRNTTPEATPPKSPKKTLTLADVLRGRFYSALPIRVERLSIRGGEYGGQVLPSDSGLALTRILVDARHLRLGRGFGFDLDTLEVLGRRRSGGPIHIGVSAALDQGGLVARTLRVESDATVIQGSLTVAVDARDSLRETSLVLSAQPLALRDLAVIAPTAAPDGAVFANIDLRGARPERLSGTVTLSAERARWGSLDLSAVQLNATVTDGRSDTKLSAVWGGARTEIAGWVRPFDPQPSYDVEARSDGLPSGGPEGGAWRALAGIQQSLALRVRGSGFSQPVLNASGRSTGELGQVDLDGGLDFSRGVAWELRRLEFEKLNLSRLMGDTTASALSGTLTASGEETPSRPRRMVADLALDPSDYGAWHVVTGRARTTIAGSVLRGSLHLETSAGLLDAESVVGHLEAPGALDLRARFEDVDLEAITQKPALASQLDGTLRGQIRGIHSLASPGGATAAIRGGRLSGQVRVDLGPSRFRGQQIQIAQLKLSLAKGGLGVDGSITSAAGQTTFLAHGRPFEPRSFYEIDRAAFADVDLAAWTGASWLGSSLSGSLKGRYQSEVDPQSSTWTSTVRLDRSTVGNTPVEGGEVKASGSRSQTKLAAEVGFGADTLVARAEVALVAGAPEGHVEASVPFAVIAALARLDTLKSTGRLTAWSSFAAPTPATMTMEGRLAGTGSVGEAKLDSLLARFRFQNGVLFLDTLLASSNLGSATGAGRLAISDTSATSKSDLRTTIVLKGALPGARMADTMAVDTATIALRIHGDRAERHIEVRGFLRSLAWKTTRLARAEGLVEGDLDAKWAPKRAHGEMSLSLLRGIGIPLNDGSARVDFDGVHTTFDVKAARDREHRLRVAGRASEDSLGRHIALETLDAGTDSAGWSLAHPAQLHFGQDKLMVDGFEWRARKGRITAHGVIDRRGNQDFRLDVKEGNLELISAWLGRPNLTGNVNGSLALEGPAAAPEGRGNLDADLFDDGRPAGTLLSRLAWEGTRLDLGGSFVSSSGDSIAWNASLPFVASLAAVESESAPKPARIGEGEVEGRLVASHFPLAAFSPFLDSRSVGIMEGTLDIDARVKGSNRAIVADGRVALNGGVVPLPSLGVTYRDIAVQAALEGDRIVLRQARAISEKGSLEASGELRLVGITRVEPRLHVKSNRFAFVVTPDLRAFASADVDLTGTLTSPVFKGKVTVENSSVNLTPVEAGSEEADAPIQLTAADLRMLEETFGDVNAPKSNLVLDLYQASEINLGVTLSRNNWVRQRSKPKLSVALTGAFTMKKKPNGEPELEGRIAPVPGRGYVEQFARSFDLTGGEVLLNGPMSEHRVDLQAQYEPPTSSESGESETVVNLAVQGPVDKLKLTLTSEPPMSEVEIMNFIATGHSAADKTQTNTTDESSLAKDIGLSQLTGPMESVAQEAIGLDVLQVRFDALRGATLVAGRYLDPQLYVGLRQPLQYKETGSSVSGEALRTRYEVEYAFYPWLVLNVQGETSELRSFIRARHGY